MKRYNVITSSDVGTFIINKYDTGVGLQLSALGAYEAHEMAIIREILRNLKECKTNLVAFDIGANIGVHTVFLAREVGCGGSVFAFEPQRIIFNMLAGNVALNSIENAYCYHLAISDLAGVINIPQYDYSRPLSFGSIEFGGTQKEPLLQQPSQNPSTQEAVACATVDSLASQPVDFMKIDVEGMEMNVLRGAVQTIGQYRPCILIEHKKSDHISMVNWFIETGYAVYDSVEGNYVCLPEEKGIEIPGLNRVGAPG